MKSKLVLILTGTEQNTAAHNLKPGKNKSASLQFLEGSFVFPGAFPQGPRSNFEIGGGGGMTEYWVGGGKYTFSY